MRGRRPGLLAVVFVGLVLSACAAGGPGAGEGSGAAEGVDGRRAPIDHIIVLFLENRTFDHLFGTYPGVEGLASYSGKQADTSGMTYPNLPAPLGRDGKPDSRIPADLPNAPFALQKFVAPFDQTNNPVHRFYHMQRQYGVGTDGVAMGTWVAEGTSGGTSMGYFDRYASPAQWKLADEFVLLDHWFQGIHGGSFANHFYLISAGLARWTEAPAALRASGVGPEGRVEKDGEVDPDGWVVNNLDPPYPPQRVDRILRAPQTVPTIADRLDAARITWAWYATGWGGGADAVKRGLVPHHNPFQYVKRIMETPDGRAHIRDASEFGRALREGGLPAVSFVKPHAKDNAHAASSTVGAGDRWIADMVRGIMASRYWPRVAVVITYDEGGGWFDHVRPPVVDRFGLGTRVPTLIVSPYAKRGFIGRREYDHASVLKLIEWRFGLEPLTERDRRAEAPLEAFDFTQAPRAPVGLP